MRNIFYSVLLVSFFIGVFSCSYENKPKTISLKVGVHSWPGGGPIYIGINKGFFSEEGLNIVIQKIENFDTKRAALISGQIDIDLANTMDQLLIYNENGFNAKIIAVTDQSTGGDGLVVKEGINSINDLQGKSIAYAEASPSDFFMRYILQQHNISLDKVKRKPVADPQTAGNSIIAKQVDAAVTFEPYLSQAASTPGLKLLISTKEYPTLIPGLILMNGEKLASQKESYKKFLRAWFKSVDYLKNNPEVSISIIGKGMGMDVKEVSDILGTIQIQDIESNKKLVDTAQKDNLLQLLGKISIFWKQSGYIQKELTPGNMIDPNIIGEK